jgi:hypothetical protein
VEQRRIREAVKRHLRNETHTKRTQVASREWKKKKTQGKKEKKKKGRREKEEEVDVDT